MPAREHSDWPSHPKNILVLAGRLERALDGRMKSHTAAVCQLKEKGTHSLERRRNLLWHLPGAAKRPESYGAGQEILV